MFDDVLDKKEKKKKKVLISKLQPVRCTEKVWPTDDCWRAIIALQ